ncbi:hypothetical protein [Acidobacterium sp. S8]|uniref:hypothetical protein n=1 Tax=Acidobacterium sp. S8 TaxID=1641854 RepID=UPI00131C33C8|nr:hypothetical protein [Acidobacterium sp. S8]
MSRKRFGKWLFCVAALALQMLCAQIRVAETTSELRLRIIPSTAGKQRFVPAVIWLEPLAGTDSPPFLPHGHYTLQQKNRTFIPHLQVIPTGSSVEFPNGDPFFHNVFSLFDGKRFDLGLYEAGSSKSVVFPREGISYIFCNIHPEMSAVVLTLSTPFFAIAAANDAFVLPDIPAGDYRLHVWIESVPPSILSGLNRNVHLSGRPVDLGQIKIPIPALANHDNKFGSAYDPVPKPIY